MRGPSPSPPAQICRVASIPSITGMRTSISTTSGRCSPLSRTASAPSAGARDDGDVGLRVEQRGKPGAHDLLVVGDERADHDAAPAMGRVTSTTKPPPSAAPHENVPPAIVARSRIPTRPWPAVSSPSAGPGP